MSSKTTMPLKSLKTKGEFNDDHAFEEFEVENEHPEIQSTDLHLLQVRGLRPIGSGNSFD